MHYETVDRAFDGYELQSTELRAHVPGRFPGSARVRLSDGRPGPCSAFPRGWLCSEFEPAVDRFGLHRGSSRTPVREPLRCFRFGIAHVSSRAGTGRSSICWRAGLPSRTAEGGAEPGRSLHRMARPRRSGARHRTPHCRSTSSTRFLAPS